VGLNLRSEVQYTSDMLTDDLNSEAPIAAPIGAAGPTRPLVRDQDAFCPFEGWTSRQLWDFGAFCVAKTWGREPSGGTGSFGLLVGATNGPVHLLHRAANARAGQSELGAIFVKLAFRAAAFAGLVLTAWPSAAMAHDFFLLPGQFRGAGSFEVHATVGAAFPAPETAIGQDRIGELRASEGASIAVAGQSDQPLRLTLTAARPGPHVAGGVAFSPVRLNMKANPSRSSWKNTK